MSKVPPPLLGFNNNVRHRGRIFHIQTEDSGVKHPRLVTHLFADGGRIVKTTRTDYAEHVGRADMTSVLRLMMKEQHKAMFIALRAGELDEVIVQCCGPLGPPNTKTPPPATTKATEPESLPLPASLAPEPQPAAEPPVAMPAPKHQSLPAAPTAEAPALPRRRKSKRPAVDGEGFRAEEPSSSPSLPRVAQRRRTARPNPEPPEPAVAPPAPAPSALYAAARPAAIFDPPRAEPPRSIFGESLISEKSLDEVILSYLAEDLEENTS